MGTAAGQPSPDSSVFAGKPSTKGQSSKGSPPDVGHGQQLPNSSVVSGKPSTKGQNSHHVAWHDMPVRPVDAAWAGDEELFSRNTGQEVVQENDPSHTGAVIMAYLDASQSAQYEQERCSFAEAELARPHRPK